ncbi:STAS domain-containing protein [Salipiger bermudensis]|nr:STAS domain-containing protein [Salipiger bermudensis]
MQLTVVQISAGSGQNGAGQEGAGDSSDARSGAVQEASDRGSPDRSAASDGLPPAALGPEQPGLSAAQRPVDADGAAGADLPGAVQVIRVEEDRIDSVVAIQFKDAVRALIDPRVSRVILDLERVAFIDSSGLGAIIAAMKGLDPGQQLELAALSPVVDKVFRMTRMDTIFTIHEAVPSARAAFHP